MKRAALAALAIALAPLAFAQSGAMKGMDMKGMEKMDRVHQASGVVTKVDAARGRVTIKHEPVASLNWPAMTMAFSVKDKAMLDKMPKDRKIEFAFVQQGRDYVVTSVK
jgi:Cu(I)/Ag(I) efflux system protein CusF